MKKEISLIFFIFLFSQMFAYEGISKESKTKDEYRIDFYSIDKSQNPNEYEYYVKVTSNNSEEYFVWCFDELKDAAEHFKWLEKEEVVSKYESNGKQKTYDHRNSWRTYSQKAEVSGNYISFIICPIKKMDIGGKLGDKKTLLTRK